MKLSAQRTCKRSGVGVVQSTNVVLFVVSGGILVLSAILPPYRHPTGICLLQNVIGIPCPGCGMTRALIFLAQGQISEALRMNMLSLAAFGLLAAYFLRSILGFLGWSLAVEMRHWEKATLLATSVVATGASWAYNLWWNPTLLRP